MKSEPEIARKKSCALNRGPHLDPLPYKERGRIRDSSHRSRMTQEKVAMVFACSSIRRTLTYRRLRPPASSPVKLLLTRARRGLSRKQAGEAGKKSRGTLHPNWGEVISRTPTP